MAARVPLVAYTDTETAEDGSVMYYSKTEDGFRLPAFPGVVDRVAKVNDIQVRHDDVFVFTNPKSGSHCVCNLVYMLQHKEEILASDWSPSILMTFLEKHDASVINNCPSPRVIMTHLLPERQPRDFTTSGKGKAIYITRNAKDTVVSYYYALSNVRLYNGTMAGLIDLFLGGKMFYGDWFDHRKTFRKFVDEHSDRCLSLCFEDIKRDPVTHVRRIADHIGVSVTDAEISTILDLSSVSNMRENLAKQEGMAKVDSMLYRKGEVNDWKNHFTVAANERFDAEYNRRMKEHSGDIVTTVSQ